MNFLTHNFNYYDLKEMYQDLHNNAEKELKELADIIIMATCLKLDSITQGDYLDSFKKFVVNFKTNIEYQSYRQFYTSGKPEIKLIDYENDSNNFDQYKNSMILYEIESTMQMISEIYYKYSITTNQIYKFEYTFDAVVYDELYKKINDKHNNSEDFGFSQHNFNANSSKDVVLFVESQTEKLKIALFTELVSKYGTDFKINLKRDINNKLSKELVFPIEKRNSIKGEWAYAKLIELNKISGTTQEVFDTHYFKNLKNENSKLYYEKQIVMACSNFERDTLLKNIKPIDNRIQKRRI